MIKIRNSSNARENTNADYSNGLSKANLPPEYQNNILRWISRWQISCNYSLKTKLEGATEYHSIETLTFQIFHVYTLSPRA